jgi:hypothetical protein
MTAHSEEAMYLDAIAEVTFTQLVTASGLPESELVELVRYGALIPRDPDAAAWTFEARSLAVVKKAWHLRHDFELDPHGVSVVLRYLERITELEEEIRMLRARAG